MVGDGYSGAGCGLVGGLCGRVLLRFGVASGSGRDVPYVASVALLDSNGVSPCRVG